MTTQLAVRTDVNLKRLATKKARRQGLTLSFLVNRLLRNYIEEDYEIFLKSKRELEDEVTCDELFFDRDIVAAANTLSEYLRRHPIP